MFIDMGGHTFGKGGFTGGSRKGRFTRGFTGGFTKRGVHVNPVTQTVPNKNS